jgi:hypothetical protein
MKQMESKEKKEMIGVFFDKKILRVGMKLEQPKSLMRLYKKIFKRYKSFVQNIF